MNLNGNGAPTVLVAADGYVYGGIDRIYSYNAIHALDNISEPETGIEHLHLTRPELAVLLAYGKLSLYEELLASDLVAGHCPILQAEPFSPS